MLTQAKAYLATARKTIFSFSRRPEKMFFPKKSHCNMIFLVLLRKIKLLFLENMILTLGRKWKMIFFKKKYKEIWYFLQAHQKERLLKRGCAGTWSFLYYLKGWYIFSWKHDIFLGQKASDDFSQEIHGSMIYSVYTCGCYKPGVTPPAKNKSRMVLSRKNTPKGNWCSRLTSWKELQQFSVRSQRPLRAFSYIVL